MRTEQAEAAVSEIIKTGHGEKALRIEEARRGGKRQTTALIEKHAHVLQPHELSWLWRVVRANSLWRLPVIKAFASAAALSALMAGGALAQNDETMIVVTEDAMMQMSMMDGQTTVTFPLITAQQDGYIVVHSVAADGTKGEALGHASVAAGENANVAVTIPEALSAGTQLMGMLHVESNGNDTFDFGPDMTDVDSPVMRDGAPVMVMFAVPEGVTDGVMVIEHMHSPGVADPEARSASEDDDGQGDSDHGDEERDPTDEDEPAMDPNDTKTEGFIEEGEDSNREGNGDAGAEAEVDAEGEETQDTEVEGEADGSSDVQADSETTTQ